MSDNQSDSSYDPTSCNVFPLVFSSFKDQHCFADIDTPAQPSVRRSLRKCIDFWRSLEVSRFILNVIIQGYNIPFFHLPTPFSKANNASARNNSTFVSEAVNDLLKRSSGKQRLILDVRHVSAFVHKQKFKCEDLSVATQIFNKDYCLFNFDLKSVTIIESFPEHRIYLACAWDFGTGKSRYFKFCVLPFGLSSAPFIPRISNRFKILEKSGHSYCHFDGRWPRRVK